MRECSRCAEDKPLDAYYKHKRGRGGYLAYCIDCDKKAKAEYYERTKDRAKQRAAEWAASNPDKVKLAKREWKRRNPESNRKYKKSRRALESIDHFTEAEWLSLLERFNHQCLACGGKDRISADHIVPLALGGSNLISNIQPLCIPCNSRKGKKVIDYREIFKTTRRTTSG